MENVRAFPADAPPGRGWAFALRAPRTRARLAVLLIVLVALLGAVAYWWLNRNRVTTDDAFIDGNAVTLAPRVGGQVVALEAHENALVRRGQVLLRLDPRPWRAARDAAAARLEAAEAKAADAAAELARIRITAPAALEAARAALEAVRADAARADADWRRQRRMPAAATTPQARDRALAADRAAEAAVTRADATLRAADTVADRIAAARATLADRTAAVALARARLATAALDLRWTTLRAPVSGYVTIRGVQLGNTVAPGQALLSLVTRREFVTADLKETALTRVHPGERVRIRIDAFPDLALRGHVLSIQQGTGSRFSAFPAENATGNYVKVVQRVPVRISIDNPPPFALPLGLSVEPTIVLR